MRWTAPVFVTAPPDFIQESADLYLYLLRDLIDPMRPRWSDYWDAVDDAEYKSRAQRYIDKKGLNVARG